MTGGAHFTVRSLALVLSETTVGSARGTVLSMYRSEAFDSLEETNAAPDNILPLRVKKGRVGRREDVGQVLSRVG